MNTAVNICGLTLKNPVIAASGTFGFGREYDGFFDIEKLGGIALKGLTLEPRQGNPPPRVAETPSGMLNSVGLQNPGVEAFLRDEMPFLDGKNTVLIANAAASTEDEYARIVERLSASGVHMIELNISCPNVKAGGAQFGSNPASVERVTRAAKAVAKKPLMVKLSPNVESIADCARAAEQGGADAISLINTLVGMAIDVRRRKPVLGNVTGGLSGPAVKPVALRMCWQAAHAVSIPVIGMGGVTTGEDVVAFMLAGCRAVQAGTAGLSNLFAWQGIIEGVERFMREQGVKDVNAFVGALED